jgi:hypothetical protein
MRAKEFITEQSKLPPEYADPMRQTYVIPGLSAADPYGNYRFGVAIARARSNAKPDVVNPYKPEWTADTAFGEHGIIAGFNSGIVPVIDTALKMTKTKGGKHLVSTGDSEDPPFVDAVSPVKPFKGYKR